MREQTTARSPDLTFSEVISVVGEVIRSAEIAGDHHEMTQRRRSMKAERRVKALRTTMQILRAAERHPDFAELVRGSAA
ncbi:hypothetical protein [Rhodoplanes serenus]|uniref:hypothetical protein n=1 Tax=Rhodoplanes serenus TaxID=200615 RepID=UPI000DAED8F7|nr:hypothetical protein [Rhodoplanes serenus]RAI33727.1 hypothetical protein CH340_11295 [Rhodoplanes serenus]